MFTPKVSPAFFGPQYSGPTTIARQQALINMTQLKRVVYTT